VLHKLLAPSRNEKSGVLGFSLPEIIAVITIIGILAAVAVPLALRQRSKGMEASMQADLSSTAVTIETTLSGLRGKPPADLAITTTGGTWSATNGGTTYATGPANSGTALTGTVWANGTYCIAATNAGATTPVTLRSDKKQVESTACPATALPSSGALPIASAANLPAAPTGVVVTTPGNNQVQAQWAAVGTATSYTVLVPGKAPVNTTLLTHTVNNISPGTLAVQVRANNAVGSGPARENTVTVLGPELFLNPAGNTFSNQITVQSGGVDITGNSVFNNNLTVGGALSGSGNISFARFLAAGDTVTSPGHSWAGDSDTGVYNSAANTLALAAGGVQAARFTNTAATFAGSGTFGDRLTVSSGGVGVTGNSSFNGTFSNTGAFTNTGTGTFGNRLTVSSGGAEVSGNTALWGQLDTFGNIGTQSNVTAVGNVTAAGAMYSSNWFRSTGTSGWHSETYGGGIHMQDTTWVRVYGGKAFYNSQVIRSDTELQVGGDGSSFRAINGGDLWSSGPAQHYLQLQTTTNGGSSEINHLNANGQSIWLAGMKANANYHIGHVSLAAGWPAFTGMEINYWTGNTTFYGSVTAQNILLISDRRAKEDFRKMSPAEVRAANKIENTIQVYHLKKEKKKVWRSGLVAQELVAILKSENLDWEDYGMVAQNKTDGWKNKQKTQVLGDEDDAKWIYSVNYQEIMMFVAEANRIEDEAQQKQIDLLQIQVDELVKKLPTTPVTP